MERQPTSRSSTIGARQECSDSRRKRGFALIEMLCVLAIIGMLAAIILPSIPRATSRARLQAYAVETAALLKADRNAAIRGASQVARRSMRRARRSAPA